MSEQRDARLGALVVGALVAALFLGTLTTLATRFLGIEYVDHYGTQWFYWFAEHQIRTGEGFGHSDLMFFPYGKDIYLHTGANVLDAILAVPFRALLGSVLGYNLFVIAGLMVSAWAFFKLALDFTEDRNAALIGAGLVTLSPFVLSEVAEGRPTQAILLFPTLFLRELWRVGSRPGLRAPILAGVFLALTGYQYWFYAFFGGMAALAAGLWRVASLPEGAGRRHEILARHALIALVSLALTLPATWSLLQASQSGDVPGLLDVSGWGEGAIRPQTQEGGGIGLFLWQPLRGMSGFLAGTDPEELQYLPQGVFTSWVAMLAAVATLLRPGRLARGPAFAIVAVCTLLAMGPVLLIGDAWVPNPPYVFLVENVSFLRRLWWPSRAYVFTNLIYGLCVVMALTWMGQIGRRMQAVVATLGVAAWGWHLHLGNLAPFPTWDATVPAGYRCLAEGEPGAIIELPFSWTQAHLYWQTVHERPILGGMLENNELFAPKEALTLREDNTFVAGLLALARSEGDEIDTWTEADKAAVGALGYRYVVLQRDAFNPPPSMPGLADNAVRARLRRMRQVLTRTLGDPVYEDARVNIYAPWGGERPCEEEGFEQDTKTLGNTEVTHGLRSNVPPGDTRLRNLLPLPEDEEEAAEGEEAGATKTEATP